MAIHTYGVASPHIHGKEVTRRQKLLNGGNVFEQDFLQGPVDGDFGPETGRACIRAKTWLGYPAKDRFPRYGERLDEHLTGKTKLSAEFAKRRAAMLRAAKRKPLRVKALERAERDLGMKEHPPGSNLSTISRLWGIQGPWCAMSVSEWYIEAGSKAFTLHHDFAYVPYMLAAAEHGTQGLAIVRAAHALPGDPVAFDWDGDGVADHVGLLRSKVEGSSFATIEGNTSSDVHGDQSNGGEVAHKTRSISDVATYNRAPAFIRVGR